MGERSRIGWPLARRLGGLLSNVRLRTEKGSLLQLLRRHGREDALAAGRVFVNGARTPTDIDLSEHDEIDVYDARRATERELSVLARRDDIIAVEKPADLSTIPDHLGTDCLVERVRAHVIAETGAAPEVVHPASRLDVGVSGVILVSLSHRAARALEAAKREGRVRRTYVAIARGALHGSGAWDAPIGETRGVVRTRPGAHARGKAARSEFVAIGNVAHPTESTALVLSPITGRTHQLRIHAAGAGAPLFGDKLHRGPAIARSTTGSVVALDRIYLHAHQVRIEGTPEITARSPLPLAFRDLWAILGGDAATWDALATHAPG